MSIPLYVEALSKTIPVAECGATWSLAWDSANWEFTFRCTFIAGSLRYGIVQVGLSPIEALRGGLEAMNKFHHEEKII